MKKLAISLFAVVALTGGVYAADAPEFIEEEPIVDNTYDWSGFYIGVKGGWATGIVLQDPPPPGVDVDVPVDGWILGGVAGAGVQMNMFYLGVEGEASWTNLSGVTTCPNPAFDCAASADWLADIEVQVGLAAGPALIYVHGGLAAVNTTAETIVFGSHTAVATGWVAGVGVKVGVTENVELVGEYSFYNVSMTTPAGTIGPDPVVVTPMFHAVTAGVNASF